MTNGPLLTVAEVAARFRVHPYTLARWLKPGGVLDGKLTEVRTPSGHRRFLESEINALLREQKGDADG